MLENKTLNATLTHVSSELRVPKPVLSHEPAPPKASAGFSDLVTSIAGNEGFSSLVLFGGLLLLLLAVLYFAARYNARRRLKSRIRFAESDDSSFSLDSDEERESPDLSGFRPNYISTESAPGILIAEEDDELRLFLTNTLRLNYRVIAVKDGLKAFRKAFDTIPDLIITDSQMPGMDGVSLCHLLKVTMATSHIPVILLNTDTSVRVVEAIPADGCIRANFDAKSLLIEIRNFMQQRKHLYAGLRKQLLNGEPVDDFFSAELDFIHRVNAVLKGGYHRTGFGADELGDGLSLTKLQLFRKMKALVNKTPNDYIRHFRVEEAKRLLAMEHSGLGDVAIRTGFNNQSVFSKAFKDVTGLSPVEFSVHSRGIANPVSDQ
jgi:CheY-like chemotaxis protein